MLLFLPLLSCLSLSGFAEATIGPPNLKVLTLENSIFGNCDKTYSEHKSSLFYSHFYAQARLWKYRPNTFCNITVAFEPGYRMLLKFLVYEIYMDNESQECSSDQFFIVDKNTTSVICHHNHSLINYVSQTNVVNFIFITNGDGESLGFVALLTRFHEGNCTKDEFQCDTNRCIGKEFLCDGNDNCADQSDESIIKAKCPVIRREEPEMLLIGIIYFIAFLSIFPLCLWIFAMISYLHHRISVYLYKRTLIPLELSLSAFQHGDFEDKPKPPRSEPKPKWLVDAEVYKKHRRMTLAAGSADEILDEVILPATIPTLKEHVDVRRILSDVHKERRYSDGTCLDRVLRPLESHEASTPVHLSPSAYPTMSILEEAIGKKQQPPMERILLHPSSYFMKLDYEKPNQQQPKRTGLTVEDCDARKKNN